MSRVTPEVHVFADAEQTSIACGVHILARLRDRVTSAPYATLAISGGSSPRRMFQFMAAASCDWPKVHLFWVDERGVPPTDPQSNYRLAYETLIAPARIPAAHVHRIQAERPPEEATRLYIEEIRKLFGDGIPQFDIIHRGIGPDAHTASLFPGEPLIDDREHIAAAVYVEKFSQWRITLLPAVLLAARQTVMLVEGEDKAEPLHAVLYGPNDPKRYPAQIASNATWFLDAAAAARLIHKQ
jgi:6-phosphogluconolactonase